MFAVRGQCDHGRSSHGILHSSPPAHLDFLHKNINVEAPGLPGSGQRSSSSGSDEDSSSSRVPQNISFQGYSSSSKQGRNFHAAHLQNQPIDDSPPSNKNRKTKIQLKIRKKAYSCHSSSSSSDSSSSEYRPDDDSCDSSCGDMVVRKRKKHSSRKSKDDSNESKDDRDCWLESPSDKQLTDDWKLFDSELSESSSFLNSGFDENVDMSLDNDKVSFPSHKGNTPQKGPIVSSEGE